MPENCKKSKDWSIEDKLAVVIVTDPITEIQLSGYYCSLRLYKEQID